MDKLRSYIENLFETAPKTNRVFELKEELISNLNEKYNDLIKQGFNEEEAFDKVVIGIGDVDELINQIREPQSVFYERDKERKKTALVVTVSVALYIISCALAILCSDILRVHNSVTSIVILITGSIPTCILVYHFMTRPKYVKGDSTIVEEFKQWNSNNYQREKLCKTIISIMWSLITLIYVVISFVFGLWESSWIIFIIGAILSKTIKLYFELKDAKEA